MKKIFLLAIMLGILSGGYAQETNRQKDADDTLAPYQKYPVLPAFNVLEMDSVTIFNTYNIPKGRPVILFFFSPDCSHCKRMTTELIAKIDSFRDVDFYMITPVHSMSDIKKYYGEHHLADHRNIKLVGRDYEFFFGSYYKIRSVPDVALYDADKKLVRLFEGEAPLHLIYEALHKDHQR
jgi:thiol-disulfide isomerase/thioredoxin